MQKFCLLHLRATDYIVERTLPKWPKRGAKTITWETCSLLGAGVPETMIEQEIKKKYNQRENVRNYYH